MDSIFLTTKEAAVLLHYKKTDTINLLCRTGKIKAYKRGNKWLIERESFLRFCKALCG